jgi:hypothetical protein
VQSVLLVAATLACPVGMSLMMWMMMRGHGSAHQSLNSVSEQIDELRAEIERLKAEDTTDSRSGVCDVGMARRGKAHRYGMWRRARKSSTIWVRRQ